MNNPPPRPALRRAPDAEVHPARPGVPQLRSIPSRVEVATLDEPVTSAGGPEPVGQAEPHDAAKPGKKKSKKRPATSDTLLAPAPELSAPVSKKSKDGKKSKKAKGTAAATKRPATQAVQLETSLYDSLDRQASAQGYAADEVVALLVRAWLES